MRRQKAWVVILVLTGLLTLIVVGLAPHSAETAALTPGVEIIESTSDHIILDVVTGAVTLSTVAQAGQTFDRLEIEGLGWHSVPGKPQLPVQGMLLGVPTDQGVVVELLSAETELLSGLKIEPAPKYEVDNPDADLLAGNVSLNPVFAFDQALYAMDAYYPEQTLFVADTGYLRDQAFAKIEHNPVQYNPITGDALLTTRAVIKLSWDAAVAAPASEVLSPPEFERVLETTLLNYDTLDRPQPATRDQRQNVRVGSGIVSQLNVRIADSGIYRLTRSDFTDAGIDVSGIDPRNIKLHNFGSPVAVYVTGEADGSFDVGDTITFYGEAYEDMYTDLNNYVVSWGSGAGMRMTTRDVAPQSAPLATAFRTSLVAEKDTNYWWTMPDGHGKDHWFWDGRIAALTSNLPTSRDYTVTLPPITGTSDSAEIMVTLEGFTSNAHGSRVYLNGTLVDTQVWAGFTSFEHVISVPQVVLNSGDNTVRVEAFDAGGGSHQFYMNWIQVEYEGAFEADNDIVWFNAPENVSQKRYELTGFSTNAVQLFDVTKTAAPARLLNGVVSADGSQFKLTMEESAQNNKRYVAVTPAQIKTPAEIEADQPSNWQSTANGADYIIIASDYLMEEVMPLADLRSADGLRVAVANIDDLYDEFNDGIQNPAAIRDFLSYAYNNWQAPAPLYVVLAGDASYDYKNNQDLSSHRNFVPSQIIEADDVIGYEGQAPSDNWFVTIVGNDILPDMFIGRLPSAEEDRITAHVDKIIHYANNPPDASWNTNAFYVTDDDAGIDFVAYSESIQAELPDGFTASHVYASDYVAGVNTTDDIRNDIVAGIDAGALMVHYTGHGNVSRWGSWNHGVNFWNRDDIVTLGNADKYPFVTVGDCLNGYFITPTDRSLSEEFVRESDKGAVAVWAPSWLGYSSGHTLLARMLYQSMFDDYLYYLGDATTAAKINAYANSSAWGEMVETYILFGDPYTRLGAPLDPPAVTQTTPQDGATNVAIDRSITVKFDREMVPSTVSLSGLPGVTFTPAWSADAKTVTFSHSGLPYGVVANMTVLGRDRFGIDVDPATSAWTFSITDDATPPGVVLDINAGNYSDVPLTADVSIVFTETVRFTSVEFSIDPPVVGRFIWNVAGESGVFVHPADPFKVGQTYTFTIENAIDLAGNPLPVAQSLTFATTDEDTVAPQLLRFNVEGGSTLNVPLDASIEMEFNEEMNPASLAYTFTPGVAGDISWNAGHTSATFNPSTSYADDQSYVLAITAAQDVAGNDLANAPVLLNFTTVAVDTTPPTVVFSATGGNVSAVPLDGLLHFDFNENMDEASVIVELSPDNAGTPTATWIGTRLTLDYPTDFTQTQAYSVEISGSDPAGNPLSGQTTFDFTTETVDAIPPTATIAIVGNPALDDVPADAQFTITFSEPMNKATVDAMFAPSALFAGAWGTQNQVLTITPLSPLTNGTEYTLSIAAGAEDEAGNGTAAPITLDFTVEASDATPPTATIAVVGNPVLDDVPADAQFTITFSEPMNTATVDAIFAPTALFTGIWGTQNQVLTITPLMPLTKGAQYTLTLPAGAEDEAGNATTITSVLEFVVESEPSEPLILLPIVLR